MEYLKFSNAKSAGTEELTVQLVCWTYLRTLQPSYASIRWRWRYNRPYNKSLFSIYWTCPAWAARRPLPSFTSISSCAEADRDSATGTVCSVYAGWWIAVSHHFSELFGWVRLERSRRGDKWPIITSASVCDFCSRGSATFAVDHTAPATHTAERFVVRGLLYALSACHSDAPCSALSYRSQDNYHTADCWSYHLRPDPAPSMQGFRSWGLGDRDPLKM